MLLEYLIDSAIGFAGMFGILQFAAEITALHQQIIQAHAAAAVLREWLALAQLIGDPIVAWEFCSGASHTHFADTCQLLADRLKHLPDHAAAITSEGDLTLTWRDLGGYQISAQIGSELLW